MHLLPHLCPGRDDRRLGPYLAAHGRHEILSRCAGAIPGQAAPVPPAIPDARLQVDQDRDEGPGRVDLRTLEGTTETTPAAAGQHPAGQAAVRLAWVPLVPRIATGKGRFVEAARTHPAQLRQTDRLGLPGRNSPPAGRQASGSRLRILQATAIRPVGLPRGGPRPFTGPLAPGICRRRDADAALCGLSRPRHGDQPASRDHCRGE